MNKTKPTKKPGLTDEMKAARLAWCLERRSWTLEDWKKVIWSDETSVVLCTRRGENRVWRTSEEHVVKGVIRERWKGYSEFMFWACYSWEKKGPRHVWRPETKKEKQSAQEVLDELNSQLGPTMRFEWQKEDERYAAAYAANPQRARHRRWKWCEATGKLERREGKGVDWYRYQKEIHIDKLIPFAKEMGPDALVQEDKAPSHAHVAQAQIFADCGVQRLIWCGNSPDLNMIEPVWPEMKIRTTKYGPPQNRVDGEKAWRKCWEEFEMEKLRRFVERVPWNIEQIIQCNGGNEYIEGRNKEEQEEFRRLVRVMSAFNL